MTGTPRTIFYKIVILALPINLTIDLAFGMLEILLSCSENTISACEVFSDSLDFRTIAAIDRAKDGRA